MQQPDRDALYELKRRGLGVREDGGLWRAYAPEAEQAMAHRTRRSGLMTSVAVSTPSMTLLATASTPVELLEKLKNRSRGLE